MTDTPRLWDRRADETPKFLRGLPRLRPYKYWPNFSFSQRLPPLSATVGPPAITPDGPSHAPSAPLPPLLAPRASRAYPCT